MYNYGVAKDMLIGEKTRILLDKIHTCIHKECGFLHDDRINIATK